MQLKKTLRQVVHEAVQPTIGYTLGIMAMLGILSYRLRYLVPGFSEPEKLAIAASRSVQMVLENPLYAPHKVLQYIMAKLTHTGFIAMRGISVLITIGVLVLFFYTVRRWFSFRIALISTFLFATSSWLLHIARLATPDIMSLGLMAAIAYGTWLPFNTKRPRLALALGVGLCIWLLYTPGMVWFVLLGAMWQRKTITQVVRRSKAWTVITATSVIALVAPLLYALARDTSLIPTYLGLSSLTVDQLVHGAKQLALLPVHLLAVGPQDPVRWLGRMPLIDLFAAVMAVLGAYNYFQQDRKLDRYKLLLGGLVLSSLLACFGGVVGLYILLPFIYLLVASGVAYMVEQWFKVFPSNPFAKILATGLLVGALLAVSFYHINHYFIAWPQAPITKSTFSQQPETP